MAIETRRPLPINQQPIQFAHRHDPNFVTSRLQGISQGIDGVFKGLSDTANGNLRSVAEKVGSKLEGIVVGELDGSRLSSSLDKNIARAKPVIIKVFQEIIQRGPDLTDKQINRMVKQYFLQKKNLNELPVVFSNAARESTYHVRVADMILGNPNKYLAKVEANKVNKVAIKINAALLSTGAVVGTLVGGTVGAGIGVLNRSVSSSAQKGALIGLGLGTVVGCVPSLAISAVFTPIRKTVELSSKAYLNQVNPQPAPASVMNTVTSNR
ncbi:MAG: hypothetical protein V4629_10925 [Pseudomonadota bacterium]